MLGNHRPAQAHPTKPTLHILVPGPQGLFKPPPEVSKGLASVEGVIQQRLQELGLDHITEHVAELQLVDASVILTGLSVFVDIVADLGELLAKTSFPGCAVSISPPGLRGLEHPAPIRSGPQGAGRLFALGNGLVRPRKLSLLVSLQAVSRWVLNGSRPGEAGKASPQPRSRRTQ